MNVSCRASLVVTNSLSFYLSRNVLTSPWFLKDSFSGCTILIWQYFSFSTLNTSTHCLLASKVSNEKFADNPIEDLLYVMNHFSLIVFKILSLSLSFKSLIMMWLSVGLCIHLRVCWAFWIFIFMSFLKFGTFSGIISLKIFFCPSLSFLVGLCPWLTNVFLVCFLSFPLVIQKA